MQHYNMNLTLKVWKQKNKNEKGFFETYQVKGISSEMSFLERPVPRYAAFQDGRNAGTGKGR